MSYLAAQVVGLLATVDPGIVAITASILSFASAFSVALINSRRHQDDVAKLLIEALAKEHENRIQAEAEELVHQPHPVPQTPPV